MTYFDNSATTKLHPDVLSAMMPYLTQYYGNPSSTYRLGQESRFAIDGARRIISDYINSSPQEIVFTAGGTESINLALKGVSEALAMQGGKFEPQNIHVITSTIEHSAVLNTVKHLGVMGFKTHLIGVNLDGTLKIEDLKAIVESIAENEKFILSIQYANSEIGTIQDIKEISEIVKQKKGLIHIDAMQAFKFFPIDVEDLKLDMMTFAPHKFNGPKGIGALYIRKGTPIVRQNDGGQQEYYLRAGTENVPGIVGFGKTVEILKESREQNLQKTLEIRDYFEEKLKENFKDKIKFNSISKNKLPSISSVVFKGSQADQLLIQLDMYDICVSVGSACNSGSIQISPVLKEITSEENAIATVRFSFGHDNTKEEIDKTIEVLKTLIK